MESDTSGDEFRAVFDEAAELPPDRRESFLQQICGDNSALRVAVANLLSAHDRAGTFLAKPLIPAALLVGGDELPPGTRIGRYSLLRVLGEGGYGTVYLAEQDPPLRRRVALKVIKPGMDTRQVIARFDLERQTLAMLDHANIAKVFDAGMTETGHPYFAMELVDGVSLTEFCQRHELDVKTRLKLFVEICGAVHHAHEKGVVHRDLKPGNVLVTMQGAAPLTKIIDFGIAKALFADDNAAAAAITSEAQLLGTPQYMSPEQASVPARQIDARSDVYSLGALLYELLTDVPPFDRDRFRGVAHGEMARIVQEVDPPLPSDRLISDASNSRQSPAQLSKARDRFAFVQGNLDRIVAKAMEKDPADRYRTPAAIAEDINRHLTDQPVVATASRSRRRRERFAGRHRNVLIAGGLAVAICAAAICFAIAHRDHAPKLMARADTPLLPGLFAEIYADSRLEALQQSRVDPQIDFVWARGESPSAGIQPPHYGVRWKGVLVVPTEGLSAIGVVADDGVRLWIDDQEVVSFDRPRALLSHAVVGAGRHVIRLDYWNRLAEGSVALHWVRSGQNEETVPAAALFHVRTNLP